MKKRRILCVIPARGGSVGVPRKNIKPLNGYPLIYYPIMAAKGAKGIDRCIVSTDDAEIADIARSFGADVPFIRPNDLANGTTTLIYVMQHALHFFDEQGDVFDAVLSLQVTTPLIKSSTIDAVIDKFHDTGCDAVVTAAEIRHGHPIISKKLVNGDELVDFMEIPPNTIRYPRQKREPAYYCNGSIFLRDRKLLDNLDPYTNCLGSRPKAVVISGEEAVNIDEELDFRIAEFLMAERMKRDAGNEKD